MEGESRGILLLLLISPKLKLNYCRLWRQPAKVSIVHLAIFKLKFNYKKESDLINVFNS